MKIRVERRFARGPYLEGTEPEVYDIYHHFHFGQWMIVKAALTREEALKYISRYVLDCSCKVVINC